MGGDESRSPSCGGRKAAVWVLEVGADGLIAEERDYFDAAAVFRQLGMAA